MNTRFDLYNVPLYAESRFAYRDELIASLAAINLLDESYDKGGMPFYREDEYKIYIDPFDNHALVLGSTASQKTRRCGKTTVEILARSGESMVIADPKAEIYERCSGTLKKYGYNIMTLNFRDPLSGNSWNPLDLPYRHWLKGDESKALELANDIVSAIVFSPSSKSVDPYWEDATAQLIMGILHLLFMYGEMGNINISSLIQMVSSGIAPDGAGILNQIVADLPIDSIPFINLSAIFGLRAERTLSCILSTFYTKMRLFSLNQELRVMLTSSDIDVTRIGFEKAALFIIMPDEKTTMNFLISLFIKQLYQCLVDAAQGVPGGALPNRVNFILDEFANLPTINDMPAMISASRSRNLRFYLFVQSMNALISKYGEDAHAIMGNCGNWIFLTSRELPLLNLLSELCGNDGYGNRLISTSQLQRLSKEKGEALILCGRNYPFIANLPDIDEYPYDCLPPVQFPRKQILETDPFSAQDFIKAFKSAMLKEQLDQLF